MFRAPCRRAMVGLLVVALAPLPGASARADRLVGDVPEYREIQQRLATGWNTWNSRSVLAHVLLPEGFIPNDNRGNGSKSFDRSQPPVGSIMVREIAKRFPQRWFVEAMFDPLWEWNRWWLRRRLNEGLLSYGSHAAKNPFREPATRSKRTAGYESGLDDSPMYEGVPFNQEKNTLELQDVGLTSLWIADSEALAELAEAIDRGAEAVERPLPLLGRVVWCHGVGGGWGDAGSARWVPETKPLGSLA